MNAVWQIVSTGTDQQRRDAIDVLVETRRKLYGLLAEGGPRMSDQELRISDAEREQAAADLGEHYAQGRITTEEHRERLDQIWAARTRRELGPVFADLPGRTFPARGSGGRPTCAAPRPGGAGSRRRCWCCSWSWSRSPQSPTCR